MEQRLQEYENRMKEYEQKLKTKEEIERQNRLMADDFNRLKEAYVKLEHQYGEAEQVVQRHELLKNKYESLPQENTTLHYNLGVLYAQNQQFEKAVSEFEKVLSFKPDDIESIYNLGVIYGEHLNNRKKAVSYFKRYLTIAPDDADAQRVTEIHPDMGDLRTGNERWKINSSPSRRFRASTIFRTRWSTVIPTPGFSAVSFKKGNTRYYERRTVDRRIRKISALGQGRVFAGAYTEAVSGKMRKE